MSSYLELSSKYEFLHYVSMVNDTDKIESLLKSKPHLILTLDGTYDHGVQNNVPKLNSILDKLSNSFMKYIFENIDTNEYKSIDNFIISNLKYPKFTLELIKILMNKKHTFSDKINLYTLNIDNRTDGVELYRFFLEKGYKMEHEDGQILMTYGRRSFINKQPHEYPLSYNIKYGNHVNVEAMVGAGVHLFRITDFIDWDGYDEEDRRRNFESDYTYEDNSDTHRATNAYIKACFNRLKDNPKMFQYLCVKYKAYDDYEDLISNLQK